MGATALDEGQAATGGTVRLTTDLPGDALWAAWERRTPVPTDDPDTTDAACEQAWLSWHNVAPLLAHTAGHRNPSPAIREAALRARAVHLAQGRMLAECAAALDGLPWLILKGAALGARLYPDPTLRTGSDIDVLVPPAHAEEALQRLETRDFERGLNVGGSLVFREQALHWRGGPSATVDLHWALSNRPGLAECFAFDELWAERVELPLDVPAAGLSSVHALLHTALHRYGHHGRDPERLIWLIDAHLLWGALDEAERDRSVELATDRRIAGLLGGLLQATRQALKTEIDDERIEWLHDRGRKERFGKYLEPRDPGLRFHLGSLPAGQRLRYLLQTLFPSSDYMRRRYVDSHLPLPLLYLRRITGGLAKRVAR